jgi:hypothetical protein
VTTGALEAAFDFTADDLAANRAGRLSTVQQGRMSTARTRGQATNLIMGGVFLVLLVVIAIVVLPGAMAPQASGSSAIPPGFIVLGLVVVAGIIALTLLRSRRGINRLTGAVFPVEGVAHTRARFFGDDSGVDTGMIYRVSIGGKTFVLINQQQVDAFEDGKDYRGYYVKGTVAVLVSVEPT